MLERTPPSTRYQGSKLKLLPFIGSHLSDLEFESALDAFGGTGSVSYMLKARGKAVTYNVTRCGATAGSNNAITIVAAPTAIGIPGGTRSDIFPTAIEKSSGHSE